MSQSASNTSKAVLVVEDDQSIREALKEALECEGFSVSCAIHGREALALLNGGFRPCLIILDLSMPVMNGWDFLEARNQDPALADIPVIVCSATGERRAVERVNLMLRKPIHLRELLTEVSRFCAEPQQ